VLPAPPKYSTTHAAADLAAPPPITLPQPVNAQLSPPSSSALTPPTAQPTDLPEESSSLTVRAPYPEVPERPCAPALRAPHPDVQQTDCTVEGHVEGDSDDDLHLICLSDSPSIRSSRHQHLRESDLNTSSTSASDPMSTSVARYSVRALTNYSRLSQAQSEADSVFG
jgi:hypothetical protein